MKYESARERRVRAAYLADAQKRQTAKRKSARARGYDAAWEKLRGEIVRLALDTPGAICELCGQEFEAHNSKAIHVDHKQRIADAPHRRLDRENLRPVHGHCHSRLTAQEDRARERGFTVGAAADGVPTDPRHPFNRGSR